MTDDAPLTLREVALEASRKVGGLQGRALDREAKKRGLTLSYTTVDKIIAGTYNSRPKAATLAALAQLSGIPLARVYDAAGLPMPLSPLAESLPPDADLLSPEQRRVVIDVVRQFAKQNRELDEARRAQEAGGEHDSTPKYPAGESPAPVVPIRRKGDVSEVDHIMAASDDEEAAREFESHEDQP
jgi:hypothetical protein